MITILASVMLKVMMVLWWKICMAIIMIFLGVSASCRADEDEDDNDCCEEDGNRMVEMLKI